MSAKTNSDTAENTGMTDITLTPQQKKAWEDVMSMMVWTAPGFQHIFYKLLNGQNSGREHVAIMSRDVPVAATDGRNVIINPDTFFGEFNLREQVFVTAHEIIHNVYGDVELLHRCRTSSRVPLHDGTHRPFDNDCMQKAMDARINALLIESRIGKAPKKGHFDDQVAGADSVLDIYQRYYDKKYPDGDGGDQPGPGDQQGNQNPGGFDQLMPPGAATGQNPQQAAGQRNQQQWAVEIASAQTIEQQRSQGKMAAALKRMFKELLEPEVPWVDHIETLINRATGGGGYDWTQPNPWLGGTDTGDQYFAPADTGHGAGWIVIWGDKIGRAHV